MATAKPKVNKKALLASATLAEYRAAGGDEMGSENQRIRDDLVRREVVQCVSALVHQIAKHPEALEDSGYIDEDVWEL